MSIEDALANMVAAQTRTANALEDILAVLKAGGTATVSDAAKQEAADAIDAKVAAAKKTTADAAAQKKADEAAAAKKAEEEAAKQDEVDPLDEAEEKAEEFTEDQVRKALKDYRDINGADAVMAILGKHGAKGMGTLKVEDYAAVMKEVR